MTVYVDGLKPIVQNDNWKWDSACHMVADSEEELLDFAERLGLKRSWFQRGPYPHFDLTRAKRLQAVRLGARSISRAELMQVLNKNKRDGKP